MNQLQIIVHDNRRVLTTSQIAESYGADEKLIQQNFNNNKVRYKEGKHFFLLQGSELKAFKDHFENLGLVKKNTASLYLWTEKGAWLHAKSLNTDQAWDAYEMLVDDYYNIKQSEMPTTYKEALVALLEREEERERLELENKMYQQQIADAQPKLTYVDEVLKCTDLLVTSQIAEDYGMSAIAFNKLLNEHGIQYSSNKQWLLYSKHKGEGYTKSETIEYPKPDGTKGVKLHTKWTQKGRLFLYETLKVKGILPSIEQMKLRLVENTDSKWQGAGC